MNSSSVKVVAVIVSFNRKALLREAIIALLEQDYRSLEVLVLDNASTDGSVDMVLQEFPQVTLHKISKNTGGAGGFTAGIALALQMNPKYIWVMDDDTIPTPTALSNLVSALEVSGLSVAGSKVIWTDGSDHPMNTPRQYVFASLKNRKKANEVAGMAIRSTSFVSMLFRAEKVYEKGLPVADYFIWNDDFEYSSRLIRGSIGVFVPSSVVVHKTKKLSSAKDDPGERFFYEVRNKLWLFRHSKSFNIFEKSIYRALAFIRWRKTISNSANKKLLLGAKAAAKKAAETPPRTNSAVFDFDEVISSQISEIDNNV